MTVACLFGALSLWSSGSLAANVEDQQVQIFMRSLQPVIQTYLQANDGYPENWEEFYRWHRNINSNFPETLEQDTGLDPAEHFAFVAETSTPSGAERVPVLVSTEAVPQSEGGNPGRYLMYCDSSTGNPTATTWLPESEALALFAEVGASLPGTSAPLAEADQRTRFSTRGSAQEPTEAAEATNLQAQDQRAQTIPGKTQSKPTEDESSSAGFFALMTALAVAFLATVAVFAIRNRKRSE